MTEQNERPKQDSISEKIEELWGRVVEALEDLVNPEPQLVPIPVRRRPPQRRR